MDFGMVNNFHEDGTKTSFETDNLTGEVQMDPNLKGDGDSKTRSNEERLETIQRLSVHSDENEDSCDEKQVNFSKRLVIDSDDDSVGVNRAEKQIKFKKRLFIDSDDDEDDQHIRDSERTKTNRRLIVDSDDELGDSGFVNESRISPDLIKENDNSANVNNNETENGNLNSASKSASKSRRLVKVFSDSDSDEESTETITPIVTESNKFSALKQKKKQSDKPEVTSNVVSYFTNKLSTNNDLYDAEESSSDDERFPPSGGEEENFEIGLEDIKKKVRDSLKEKPARKVASGRRLSKPKKSEINYLHSESQRLLREGRVNLPYHVPPKKTLDEFLNRKKLTTSTLKPTFAELKKTIEEIEKARQEEESLKKLAETKSQFDESNKKEDASICKKEEDASIYNKEEENASICKKEEDASICNKEEENANICNKEEEDANICNKEEELANENDATIETKDNISSCLKDSSARANCIDNNLPLSKFLLLKNRMISSAPKPKLNGSPNDIICLDDDETPSEVEEFIKRLSKHCLASTKIHDPLRQVELNILKSGLDSEGEVVLSSEKIKVTLKANDVKTPANRPGANMMLWKRKLEEEMAKRRSQARQKLLDTIRLDNEDGFENDACKDEEDLQKLTEDDSESETEEETESEDEQVIIEKPRINNKFISIEAEEEDEDDFSSDEEGEVDEPEDETTEEHPADEEIKELKPKGELVRQESFKLKLDFSQSFDSQTMTIQNTDCDNGLPLNDDFSQASPSQSEKMLSSQYVLGSFFNISPKVNEYLPTLMNEQESVSTQDNLDELVGLCSGKWTSPVKDKQKCIAVDDEEDFSQSSDLQKIALSENVHEVPEQNSFNRDTQKILSDDELSISSLLSDTLKTKKVKRIISDSEDSDNDKDSEKDDLSDVESNDDEGSNASKKRRNKFFDDEAELSGSDVPSDEEEDVAEEDDVMLEELGDLEEFSEDELKNQVEKVHAKLMLDDDQRRLRHFKELYLEDGELHLEGQQRMRKFKWKNSGETDNLNVSNHGGSDSDDKEDDNDFEIRKLRFQRNSWLINEQNKSSVSLSFDQVEDESVLPYFKKKIQILNRNKNSCQKSKSQDENAIPSKQIPKSAILTGSFLSKSDKLSRIANFVKVNEDGPSGPKNSRNFVFAAKSPCDEKPQAKRASTFPSTNVRSAKRLCIEKAASINSQDSIFNLL